MSSFQVILFIGRNLTESNRMNQFLLSDQFLCTCVNIYAMHDTRYFSLKTDEIERRKHQKPFLLPWTFTLRHCRVSNIRSMPVERFFFHRFWHHKHKTLVEFFSATLSEHFLSLSLSIYLMCQRKPTKYQEKLLISSGRIFFLCLFLAFFVYRKT